MHKDCFWKTLIISMKWKDRRIRARVISSCKEYYNCFAEYIAKRKKRERNLIQTKQFEKHLFLYHPIKKLSP